MTGDCPNCLVNVDGVPGVRACTTDAGSRVLLVEERRLGATAWDEGVLERIEALAAEATAAGAQILEHHTAVGLYEGPFVPVVGPVEVLHVEASRVVAATGAVEAHAVFPGNDLPGVFLARVATLLGVRHGIAPGRRAVVVATTDEGRASAPALRNVGMQVLVHDGPVIAAEGDRHVDAGGVE